MITEKTRARIVHIWESNIGGSGGIKIVDTINQPPPTLHRRLLTAICQTNLITCDPDEAVSPEEHIFNFFKLLYLSNIPITDDLVEKIWVYNYRTLGALTKCPKISWNPGSKKFKFVPSALLEVAIEHTRLFWKSFRLEEHPVKFLSLTEKSVGFLFDRFSVDSAKEGKSFFYPPVGVETLMYSLMSTGQCGFERNTNGYYFPLYKIMEETERWESL